MSALTQEQIALIVSEVTKATASQGPPQSPEAAQTQVYIIVIISCLSALLSSGVFMGIVVWFGRGAIKNWFRDSLQSSLANDPTIARFASDFESHNARMETMEKSMFSIVGDRLNKHDERMSAAESKLAVYDNRLKNLENRK